MVTSHPFSLATTRKQSGPRWNSTNVVKKSSLWVNVFKNMTVCYSKYIVNQPNIIMENNLSITEINKRLREALKGLELPEGARCDGCPKRVLQYLDRLMKTEADLDHPIVSGPRPKLTEEEQHKKHSEACMRYKRWNTEKITAYNREYIAQRRSRRNSMHPKPQNKMQCIG